MYVFKKEHDRESFYKYATVETAKLIFADETLRWSNPILFNDPFDSQAGLHWDINVNDLPTLFMNRVEELAKSEQDPVFLTESNWGEFVRQIRASLRTQAFDRRKFESVFFPTFKELGERLENDRKNYVPFRDSYFKKCRVLCLASEPDNILMWTHYAANHQGVSFKLKVAEHEEEDDPLWLARPVNYLKKATPFVDSSVVDQVLGLKKLTLFNPGDFWKWAHEKYEGWMYEKEWRVVDPGEKELSQGYEDIRFDLNKKLEAVYFGVRCSKKNREDIFSILKEKSPAIKYFQARKHTHDYKVEFDPITF